MSQSGSSAPVWTLVFTKLALPRFVWLLRYQQQALAKPVELSAGILGSFEQLHFGDLPFSLTVVPRQGERGADSSAVMLETCCEGHDGTDAAVARVGEPGIKGVNTMRLPLADDPCSTDEIDESLDECRRLGVLLDAHVRLGILGRSHFGCLDDEPGELNGREQLPCRWQCGRSLRQCDIAPAVRRVLVDSGSPGLESAPDLFRRAGKAERLDLAPQLRSVLAAFAYPRLKVADTDY